MTDRLVERLEPPDPTADGRGVRFVRDAKLTGFGVRITETGSRAFIFETKFKTRHAKHSRRIVLGSYPTVGTEQARRKALALWAAAIEGKDPGRIGEPENDRTFAALIAAWRTGSLHDGDQRNVPLQKRKRSAHDDEQRIRDFFEGDFVSPPFANRYLDEITFDEVTDLHAKIASESVRSHSRAPECPVSHVAASASFDDGFVYAVAKNSELKRVSCGS